MRCSENPLGVSRMGCVRLSVINKEGMGVAGSECQCSSRSKLCIPILGQRRAAPLVYAFANTVSVRGVEDDGWIWMQASKRNFEFGGRARAAPNPFVLKFKLGSSKDNRLSETG